MNELIRKLAINSGIDIRGHLSGVLTLDEKPSIVDLEKFAELIVRACADVGERYADGNYEVPRQILEHFGVEE